MIIIDCTSACTCTHFDEVMESLDNNYDSNSDGGENCEHKSKIDLILLRNKKIKENKRFTAKRATQTK